MDHETDALPLLEHRDFMRALARRLVADEQRAEDVAQQAWVVALERSAALPPVARLRGWLGAIVRNLSRKSEARERERRAVELRAARAGKQDESLAAAEFELLHELSRALRALPEPYKTAIHLRYYQELQPAAIAAREGLSVHTVKTRLRRGLALLRAEMDARHGGQRAVWVVPLAGFLERGATVAVAGGATGFATGALVQGVLTMKVAAWAFVSVTALGAIYWIAREPSRGAEPARPAELVADADAATRASRAPGPLAPARDARALVVDERESLAGVPAAAAPRVVTLHVTGDAGAALAGAQVTLAGALAGVATDAAGRAALELARSSPQGTFTEHDLRVEAPGFLPLQQQVTLAPETRDLGVFALVRAGRIEGHVVDAAGLGIADALVLAADPGELPFPWVYGSGARGRAGAGTTRSGSAGAFVLDAVRPGSFRIWAGDGGASDGCSGIVRVVAGEVTRGVEIRLEPRPGSDEISGVVVLPPGVEARGLMVWARHGAADETRTRTTPVGANGRFRVHVEQLEPHDLWVSEQPGEWDEQRHVFVGERTLAGWRGVVVAGVAPGTQDLVLVLEQAPGIELRVSDPDGNPIDPFELLTVTYDGRDLSYQVPWRTSASPGERVSVPASGFQLSIAAEGFDSATFGPFTPTSAPAHLDVVLAPLPAVRGRVLAAGKPLAGARVELYAEAPSNKRVVARGMLLRTRSAPSAIGTSDGQGAFALTLRESGRFLVRASAPGWAAGVIDAEIDHEMGEQGLELALTRGGAIEGQVLLPPGASPAGWLVGATLGDPHGERRVLSEDGRFRFEGLTPGAWWVGRLTQDLESTTIQSSKEPVVWESTCTVREGETTRFDLDFRDAVQCTLKGRITTAAEAQRSWNATLKTLTAGAGGLIGGETVDSVSVSGDGGFELVAPRPGPYVLELRDAGGDARLMVLRAFDLRPGGESWEHALELATVAGRLDLPSDADDEALCGFLVDDGRGTVTVARLSPSANGTLAPTLVPAGRGRVFCVALPPPSRDPREWPALAELTLAPGETGTIGDP